MRASTFRSTFQAACCRPRAVQHAPQMSRAAHGQQQGQQQQRRGYASWPPTDSANVPLIIAGSSALILGATYAISRGQPDVKHNDHAAQAGGQFTQGREQQGSTTPGPGGLPADAPNRPENLAVSQQKMETKPPSKRTDPQA